MKWTWVYFLIFVFFAHLTAVAVVVHPNPARADTNPTSLFAQKNLTAWCVVPFDANKRGPEERAAMLQRLGFKHFAYDWRDKDIPAFDAEVEAMKRHGIQISAWWFPTNPDDPTARIILEVCKRHDIHPQLWVMGGGSEVKTPAEQAKRVELEADRIGRIVEMAGPYGCSVQLYNHDGWFGHTDNEIAVIELLKQKDITGIGMIYNFSHGHWDIDDFAAKWKRMKPYVTGVNVTGMIRSEAIIPPAQGDFELEMLRVILKSGWKGPVGLIAEQGGDAEVTLSNGLNGLQWLSKELRAPGSGGEKPKILTAVEKPKNTKNTDLSLHPLNPHYFLFGGKPTVLVTSAEHYGAVLNRDFNYTKYLDELAKHRLNLTRTFTGVYFEDTKSFGISNNTLAPKDGKLICPWARSGVPGYAGGGAKFDLTRWDVDYFRRLKEFLTQAGKRGIVVELNLFCPFYEDSMWLLSPMNAVNNVNGIGGIERNSAYNRSKNGELQAAQEALVTKLVNELNGFGNLYFEVCNEPYFGGVTEDWQRRIVDVITMAEKPFENKHLISLNIANGSKKVVDPHPAVSIFNFHYSSPPTAVKENFGLNKVVGENETGFKGTGDTHYRMEAWEFMLAGGGLFNNLDYSFAVGFEDGTYKYPEKSPGGGNSGFRSQLSILKRFIEGFDFIRMKPDEVVIQGGLPVNCRSTVLSEPGKHYAVYFFGGTSIKPSMSLPAGNYKAEWVSTITGQVLKSEAFKANEIAIELVSPEFSQDIALRINRTR